MLADLLCDVGVDQFKELNYEGGELKPEGHPQTKECILNNARIRRT